MQTIKSLILYHKLLDLLSFFGCCKQKIYMATLSINLPCFRIDHHIHREETVPRLCVSATNIIKNIMLYVVYVDIKYFTTILLFSPGYPIIEVQDTPTAKQQINWEYARRIFSIVFVGFFFVLV